MKAISLLAFSATAYAVAFDGPAPTPVDPNALLKGFSAKPTAKPRAVPALFRRQASDDAAVCGYLQGDAELPVSCTIGDCYHATSLGWFGCCTGSSVSDCAIATSCIPSASVSSCLEDATCSADPYLTACTEATAPFCGNLYSTQIDGGVVSHLVCVATETSVEVLPTVVGGGVVSSILAGTQTRVSARPTTATEDEGEEETSAGPRTTGPRTSVGGQIGSGGSAATTTRSTAGAAMQTAQAIAGIAAGGIVGALALLL